tara:strand:+ start:3027 stop:3524 length:498 start_codon:yes stop_codon:yes gene_type:complete
MFKQTDTIAAFGPPLLVIECVQCNRRGQMQLHTAVRRFGMITISDLLRRVAEDGGCPSVARNQCAAIVQPTPVTYWAKLSNAQDNGWRPVLVCQRRHYALKRVRPCPAVALDLTTLVGTHGRQCSLERLERWARCPQCDSGGATIRWILPSDDTKFRDSSEMVQL